MISFQKTEFIDSSIEDVPSFSDSAKEQGLHFVQLCATTLENGCELVYTFEREAGKESTLIAYVVEVPSGIHVPSITNNFPAAFVFENEAHDLFGIDIDNINIDFNGEFYTVAVEYPMNPAAAKDSSSDKKEVGDE